MNWVKFKAQSQLNKKCSAVKHTKIKGVPKLDDANDAGNVGKRPQSVQFSILRMEMTCSPTVLTIFSYRWEELHWLHADSYRGRLSQDTCCVWAGSGRKGPLWSLPSQRKNAQCPGGFT